MKKDEMKELKGGFRPAFSVSEEETVVRKISNQEISICTPFTTIPSCNPTFTMISCPAW